MTRVNARLRPWYRIGVAVSAAVVAVVTLRGSMPGLSSIVAALRAAEVWWVLAAALIQFVSLDMFVHQHRSLLRSMGVPVALARVRAVTYAGSAISVSMPAGSAVSAGFVFGQYRRSGAPGPVAAAAIGLSGLISAAGLGLLYAGGVLGVLMLHSALARSVCVLVALCSVALVGAALAGLATRRAAARVPRDQGKSLDHAAERGVAGLGAKVRGAVRASASLSRPGWLVALAFATANWLADLLCLVAAARAFGLPVGVTTVAGIYLGVQIVRQIPLTPGGIGVVEAALIAGLTAAGGTAPAAAAVVLTYRLLSFWLILPVGGLAWLSLRGETSHTTNSPQEIAEVTLHSGVLPR
jgi:uncharacterized protein (TIRG00374 family)